MRRFLLSITLAFVGAVSIAQAQNAQVSGFAYGVNGEDFSLSTYQLDEEGRLRHLGHRPIDKSPARVVQDPSGKFLLAVSSTTDNLMVFRLNPVNGELTPVPGSPFATGGRSPFSIAFHPSGRFVYLGVRFQGVGAYAFNPDTGAIKALPGSPFPAQRRTREVSVHPSGKYLYAANGYSNSVSAYFINQKTGLLTQMAGSPYSVGEFGEIDYPALRMMEVPAGSGGLPISLDIDPEGRFLFVANKAGASVSAFSINFGDGSLKTVKGSPFYTGFNPYRIKVHPSGRFLFVTLWGDGQIAVQAINNKTGELKAVMGSPFTLNSDTPVDIAFNADGSQVYVSNYDGNDISLLDVDVRTGFVKLVENVRTRLGPWSLQIVEGKDVLATHETPELLLFGVSETSGVVQLKLENNTLQSVDVGANGISASALVVAPNGHFAYAINNSKSTLATYAIDQDSGKWSEVENGIVQTGQSPNDLSMDINGWYLYVTNSVSNNISVYFIEPETGVPQEVRGSPFSVGDGPVTVALDPVARYSFVLNRKSNNISVFRYISNVSPLIFEARKYGSPFVVGEEPVALVIDPTGRFAYVANANSDSISAFHVHRKTGAWSAIQDSPYQSGKKPVALAVHPGGHLLYVANEGARDIRLFQIEKSSGALISKNYSVKLDVSPKSLWVDQEGRKLVVLSKDGKQLLIYKISNKGGSLSQVSMHRLSSAMNDLWLVNR